MGPYTEKQVAGAFLVASFDLPMLIGQTFGFDARLYAVIMAILSFIPEELCIHYLNKRIEAQETEELKEDLKDDIKRKIIQGIRFFLTYILIYQQYNTY